MRKKLPTQCPPLIARSAAHPSAFPPFAARPNPPGIFPPCRSLRSLLLLCLFFPPLRSGQNTWAALLQGGKAPGLLAPLVLRAALSLRCRSLRSPALRAGGWCCSCAALRRCCSRLPSLRYGRTPPLPFGLAVVAAARLAARRSCAVGRLRSLPACRSSPRPGLRRLRLRRCAPCPHRRLRASSRGRPVFFGGAAAWLVRRSFFVTAPAWRALCCCASPSPFVPAPPGFPRRRCVPADAPLPGSAAAVPRRAAALLRSAPSAALFPPLRSGHPLAARRSFGGRPLSPAVVVVRPLVRSPLRAAVRSLHARSGCSARGGLRKRQSRAHFRWFLGVVTPRPPFPTLAQSRKKSTGNLATDVHLWYNGCRKEEEQCQHHKSWKLRASAEPR